MLLRLEDVLAEVNAVVNENIRSVTFSMVVAHEYAAAARIEARTSGSLHRPQVRHRRHAVDWNKVMCDIRTEREVRREVEAVPVRCSEIDLYDVCLWYSAPGSRNQRDSNAEFCESADKPYDYPLSPSVSNDRETCGMKDGDVHHDVIL